MRANVSAGAAFAPRGAGVAAAAAAIASRAGPMGALSGLGMDVPEPSPSAAASTLDILPPDGEVSEAMHRWPASLEDFENEIAWAN